MQWLLTHIIWQWVPEKEISHIILTEGRLELLTIKFTFFAYCTVNYISQHVSWGIGVTVN